MERDVRAFLWKMSLDADYLVPGGQDPLDAAIVATVVAVDQTFNDTTPITNTAIEVKAPALKTMEDTVRD